GALPYDLPTSLPMTQVAANSASNGQSKTPDRQAALSPMRQLLELCFETSFTVLDVVTGEMVFRGDLFPSGDLQAQIELCRAVLHRGRPELIAHREAVALLAIPMPEDDPPRFVGVAPFVVQHSEESAVVQAVVALGCDAHEATAWARRPLQTW